MSGTTRMSRATRTTRGKTYPPKLLSIYILVYGCSARAPRVADKAVSCIDSSDNPLHFVTALRYVNARHHSRAPVRLFCHCCTQA